jgi:hypothetical protein
MNTDKHGKNLCLICVYRKINGFLSLKSVSICVHLWFHLITQKVYYTIINEGVNPVMVPTIPSLTGPRQRGQRERQVALAPLEISIIQGQIVTSLFIALIC